MVYFMRRLLFGFQTILFNTGIRFRKSIDASGLVIVKGWPACIIRSGGKIILGKGVVLNSSGYLYHLNMFSSVKLYVDAPNAVIKIGENSRIHGSCIHAREKITIGKNCLIAANSQLMDSSGHDLAFKDLEIGRLLSTGYPKPVVIGDNVWIGTGVIVLPGTTIGDGAVISAGSVVSGTIPDNVLAGGNPAVVRKKIENDRSNS